MRARRYILTSVAALYFGALVGLTFMPGSSPNRTMWIWPFIAFVPVGMLLLLLMGRRRWWAVIAFSALGAAWIEAAQTVWMPAGYAEGWDVLWATSGAVLGVLLGYAMTSPRIRSMRAHENHRMVTQASSRGIPQD